MRSTVEAEGADPDNARRSARRIKAAYLTDDPRFP
jgi:hypothetical protein